MAITVVIADDHAAAQSGLRMLLARAGDIEIVAAAQDGYAAIRLADSEKPDVVLLDLSIPGLDAPTCTARIREASPQTRVVAMTAAVDDVRIGGVLEAGAVAFVRKQAGPEEFVEAVRAAAASPAPLD